MILIGKLFIRITSYNVCYTKLLRPAAGGTTSGGGTYDTGSSVTITAVPAAGYRFLNWTESGVSVSASTSYTFTLSSSRILVANFVQTFTVSIASNPAAGGTISGSYNFV